MSHDRRLERGCKAGERPWLHVLAALYVRLWGLMGANSFAYLGRYKIEYERGEGMQLVNQAGSSIDRYSRGRTAAVSRRDPEPWWFNWLLGALLGIQYQTIATTSNEGGRRE